ncbi:hypothetical protein FRC11_014881 [Ceratobasidium sp. 423]|nr:hypothetical protein FRC11_014881 [Ceratobasidium sp. 423]
MAQVDNFSHFSSTCWAGCIPGVSMCDQCLPNGANQANCAGYLAQSDTRSTASHDATSNQFIRVAPNDFQDFAIPFSFSTSERTSSDGSSASGGPKDSFVELEQTRSSLAPRPAQLAAPRRTHSKVVREQNGYTPPEPMQSVSHEPEHDAKRRKLRKNDSISAHTFAVAEPASLRKAKSLVAGDVNEVPRPLPVVNYPNTVASPIVVPTIWPREAALTRLRYLIQREVDQRAEDARLKMASLEQRPSSVKFDNELHFDVTNWILTVQAPADYEYKSIRRHLRSHLETRFHAVLLFSRYATRMSPSGFNPFLVPRREAENPYQRRVRERLIEEIALGCLAIATKFHRDFLPPLSPLTADQFLPLLGEEHPVSFDDLELVQSMIMRRLDQLQGLDYEHLDGNRGVIKDIINVTLTLVTSFC